MEPALQPGDRVVAYKWPNRSRAFHNRLQLVNRGKIYLFKSTGNNETLIKKCADVPGDTLLIGRNRAALNHREFLSGLDLPTILFSWN